MAIMQTVLARSASRCRRARPDRSCARERARAGRDDRPAAAHRARCLPPTQRLSAGGTLPPWVSSSRRSPEKPPVAGGVDARSSGCSPCSVRFGCCASSPACCFTGVKLALIGIVVYAAVRLAMGPRERR